MKILKNTLTLFALVAVFSTAAFAQQTANANVNASAVVEASLSLAVIDDVAFGTIEPLAAYLQAGSNDPTTSTNTTGTAGTLRIDGTNGIQVDVAFSSSVLLESTTTAGQTITYSPVVYDNGSGNEITTTNPSVTLSASGIAQLSIGGNLTAAPGPGTYNTQTSADPVTFTVTYN